MKSYYATKAVIRYYRAGSKLKWPDAPHVAFANLSLNDASLKMFTKQYGPLYVPAAATAQEMKSFVPDLDVAMDSQTVLRSAWERDWKALASLERTVMQRGLHPWFGVTKTLGDLRGDTPAGDALTLWADDMGILMGIAFLMDYKQGVAKICRNPDCPTPYFVQRRKGQTFCSQKCGVLVAVHRFRERQTKKKLKTQAGGKS